jgi:2-dehydro-3-deoxyphosphooctonate aldolase (KDO 8-P synthase)
MTVTGFEVLGQPIGRNRFFLIGGPCVIESESLVMRVARFLKETCEALDISCIFKSSYDKANRTSIASFRGPGLDEGLAILARVRAETGLPVLTDTHSVAEIAAVARTVDMLQIPAFLARQTDLLVAAGRTGKPVNIKKGQFLAPWDMAQAVEKVRQTGNEKILLTERGTSFGYNNLVVDMRSLSIMAETGCPVVFDATHSVQLPGGRGNSSGGQRQFVASLASAAVAAGAHGVFLEMHEDPDRALCDGPNSLALKVVPSVLERLKAIYDVTSRGGEELNPWR